MSGLKSVFLPKWQDSENPYQDQLVAHLAKLGVKVAGTPEIFFLPTVMSDAKADILHLHWLNYLVVAYGRTRTIKAPLRLVALIAQLVILRLMGVKIVWTAHNLKDHENQYPRLDRICTACVVKLSHAIIAHCEVAKQELAAAFSVKNVQKIIVIPHGNYIDFYQNQINRDTARQALGLPDSSLVLLFLGYIRPYKGVLELISAFKQLKAEQVQLVIAGKVDAESAELIAQQIEGNHNINFVPGYVADDRIQVYMNACDLVVFPYRDVLTSGGVILAMSFSRACIAPRQGCIGDVLDDTGAFLYDPDREAGLSEAIARAVASQTELLRRGDHNRKLAEQWSWSRVAEMTLDVYQKCLSR